MRAAIALFTVGLIAAGSFAADPVKRTATVDLDGVEVRAGHALGFPAVRQLRKGDTVIILREEETGFFAIQPPAGSVSWVKQIHLGKVEPGEGGKANVPVAVDGAEVLAGYEKENKPTNRITTRLPKGTIVETLGPSVRIENASWYPIVPPDGDLRWIPKAALRAASLTALAPPTPYERPEQSPFTVVPGGTKPEAVAPVAASLPRVLTDHRLWAQASQAEKSSDYATARTLYARIYQDLWDQKAERDAIVICYNRYTRCDEAVKNGNKPTPPPPSESRSESRTPAQPVSRTSNEAAKWSNAGYISEVQRVFVDGQQVFALQDDRDNVLFYLTANSGVSLKNFNRRRVQVYGVASQRPELYRPHIAVERVEPAK